LAWRALSAWCHAHRKGVNFALYSEDAINLAVPPALRGTYAGLGCEPAIDYLKSLGVTAVELLPVHQHIDDMYLVRSGKTNYWGYNSIGFFAPECSYSSSGVTGGQVTEFKRMVKKLHRAGIEVILDVVYNHSAEGDHLGPTFCFKGIDNVHYYRLASWDPIRCLGMLLGGATIDVRDRRGGPIRDDTFLVLLNAHYEPVPRSFYLARAKRSGS
jgi:Alpha amylase, catalytic domain